MNYVKGFEIGGVNAAQIPCIQGSGEPTTETEGAVGCLYMDVGTGDMYKCTAVADGVYTWVHINYKVTTTKTTGWGELTTEAGYLNNSGVVTAHASYVVSDYIPAIPGTSIEYNGVNSITNVACIIAFYDKSKTFLSDVSVFATGASSGSGVPFTGTVTIPNGAAYFRIMDYKNKVGSFAYSVYVDASTVTPWTGKKWYAFGTSITDTSYINAETGTPTGKYVPYLEEMSGLAVYNYGKAGGTIGKGGIHGGTANILDKILTTDVSDADLITIEGFVNDYACAVPIGELGDTGGTDAIADTETITICGGLYRAVQYCLENAPNALVILLTESTGKQYTLTSTGQTTSYHFNEKNSSGLLQKDYNDAILEVGKLMGIRVIDAGSKSQINCFNPEYIVDQIHHTELGGKQYAAVIWDELKNISPKVTE